MERNSSSKDSKTIIILVIVIVLLVASFIIYYIRTNSLNTNIEANSSITTSSQSEINSSLKQCLTSADNNFRDRVTFYCNNNLPYALQTKAYCDAMDFNTFLNWSYAQSEQAQSTIISNIANIVKDDLTQRDQDINNCYIRFK